MQHCLTLSTFPLTIAIFAGALIGFIISMTVPWFAENPCPVCPDNSTCTCTNLKPFYAIGIGMIISLGTLYLLQQSFARQQRAKRNAISK